MTEKIRRVNLPKIVLKWEIMFSKKDLLAVLIIIAVTLVFFAKLFYPSLSLFMTPDYGYSDIWQFNLPLKFFLSQSLKNNQLPLWSNLIAGGFPLLGESQIGAFNFTNLLFFKFLPFVYAFNLSYVFIFIFTGVGTFLYLKQIKINRLVSFFGAISFAFSGFFISQISHINLIQASSFLPWLFLFTQKILERNSIVYYFLFSIFLSQQIFSGFPQVAFITLLSLYSYYILNVITKSNPTKFLNFLKINFFILLGFSLSAIQLLPQIEFLRFSTREGGLPLTISLQYSFSLKNLLMFLNPRFLGSPEFGTYPDLIKSNFAIFWENNGFVGFLPIIATVLGIFFIRKNNLIKIYFIVLVASFLLMLGKYSPLYIINIFPPFSYFRVPSRFILPFVWSIIVISSIVLNHLKNRGKIFKFLLFLTMLLSLFHLFSFSLTYNPIKPASEVLKPPETAEYLKNLSANENYRFFLIDDSGSWNQVFENKGWQNLKPYFYFRNNLKANLNIIYSVPSLDVYAAYLTNRFSAIYGLANSGINIAGSTATIEDSSLRLLSLSNVKYLISPYEIKTLPFLTKVFETKTNYPDFLSYKIYLNSRALPRAYFVQSTIKANTVGEFVNYLNEKNFDFAKTAVVEKNLEIASTTPRNDAIIDWQKNTNTEVILKINAPTKGLLVLADSYYPGWKAFVDNQEKPILPVNINSRGIIVEKGKHIIKFIYQPLSLFLGEIISLLTFLFLIFIMFSKLFFPPHKKTKIDKKSLEVLWHQVPVDYYQEGIKKNLLQHSWHFGKLKTVLELMGKNHYIKVLDVGCASGWFLQQIALKCPKSEYTGIDPYKEAIEFGKKNYKNLRLITGDAHSLPFPDKSFDLIICTEVLEHVLDPELVLKEINRVLTPKGTAIIEMDTGNALFRLVWFFWTGILDGVWRDAHLHSFNTKKLEEMILKNGFKIHKKVVFNFTMAVAFRLLPQIP